MRLIWLGEERGQGAPRGPGGPPYFGVTFGEVSDIGDGILRPIGNRPLASGCSADDWQAGCQPVANLPQDAILPHSRRACVCHTPSLNRGCCVTRTSCYTECVLKNVTITLTEEVAKWARKQAAEENTSVSKLVGRMLEEKMRQTDEYWAAFERLKRIKPVPGFDASKRMTREQAHERR